jgi:hypothetical protein
MSVIGIVACSTGDVGWSPLAVAAAGTPEVMQRLAATIPVVSGKFWCIDEVRALGCVG